MSTHDQDLLIVARDRIAIHDVVHHLGERAGVEIRLDGRRRERRSARPASTDEERRRSDRRALDVSEQLRTVGWAFISAAAR